MYFCTKVERGGGGAGSDHLNMHMNNIIFIVPLPALCTVPYHQSLMYEVLGISLFINTIWNGLCVSEPGGLIHSWGLVFGEDTIEYNTILFKHGKKSSVYKW